MKISIQKAEILVEDYLYKAKMSKDLTKHHEFFQKARKLKEALNKAKKHEFEIPEEK